MKPNELRIFVPLAIRGIMDRLAPRLEASTGAPLLQLLDLNPVIPRRIAAGEAFDIGLTNPPYVPALIAAGQVNAKSHRAFGRVPLAIGRKAGKDVPLLDTAHEVAELLRDAESIAYTGAGTSGRTYVETLAKLGLGDAVIGKSHPMGGGEPAASVNAGAIELAVAPLTTILATPGLTPAGIFPEELGSHIDMSVFLGTSCSAAAPTALDFLTGPELDAEFAAAGVTRFELP